MRSEVNREEAVAAIERLDSVAGKLRDRVNYARRHHALIRNIEAWNTTCSAMDVVGDTCHALHAYWRRAPTPKNEKGPAYLIAYGVLHSLYLQQDAVYGWCKCLGVKPVADFNNPGAWARSIPELARARNARNDSTGHPVRRDQPKTEPISAFFIVQHSLTDEGFQLLHRDVHNRSSFRSVMFPELISDQVRVLIGVLEAVCLFLDEDDARHHRKFMHKPLTPILNKLEYPIGKLGANRGLDFVLLPVCVEEIATALGELKAAIQERDEPFGDLWEWEYRKLHKALGLLQDYGGPNRFNTDGDLADVLADFVRSAIGELRDLTEELDEKYAATKDAKAEG